MPIDKAALEAAAAEAYSKLLADDGYVRSGGFIGHFQRHAIQELDRLGAVPPPIRWQQGEPITFALRETRRVLGAYFPKELDVFVEGTSTGPLLGVSFKCMMSGIQKNVNNRWEELVGDASNLHSRYPMLSLGYVMVLPAVTRLTEGKTTRTERIIDEEGKPTPLARQIEAKLRGIRGRQKPVELPTTYEEVALAVFDFGAKKPRLNTRFPSAELRIEPFYDRLVASFRDRNKYVPDR
jgi:hypothetical protein